MSREALAAAALFAVGVMALIGAGHLATRGSGRPAGSGAIGRVLVFGQTPEGPHALYPERPRSLPRPQDFAFQLKVEDGTGPRFVRIAVEHEGAETVLHEERFEAPYLDNLDYVVRFDESAPDAFTLVVTIEAPHAEKVVSRYPIQLLGANTRFWERSDAGPAGD